MCHIGPNGFDIAWMQIQEGIWGNLFHKFAILFNFFSGIKSLAFNFKYLFREKQKFSSSAKFRKKKRPRDDSHEVLGQDAK